MPDHDSRWPPDEEDDDVDESSDDGAVADVGADVMCPYCGAPNEIALDPSGGRTQEYIEDCQVCCQPWYVRVEYRRDGTADVRLDAADGV